MINPRAIERARAEFASHGHEADFTRDLSDYLLNGYVWSSPDVFFMAKPCLYTDDGIVHLGRTERENNAWFIHSAAGFAAAFKRLFRILPYRLPLVLWCRRGKMPFRVYRVEQYERKVS